MNYEVTLILTLFSKNKSKYVTGSRKLRLSFLPSIGQAIEGGDFDFGNIERVILSEDNKNVICSQSYIAQSNDESIEFLQKKALLSGYGGFSDVRKHPKYS